jgi:hypothetical protein
MRDKTQLRRVKAQAVVHAKVRVDLSSVFGPDWTMEGIHKDAKREAVNVINEALKGRGQVEGMPCVTILVEEIDPS